jgi:hypothetical protein
LNFFDISRHFLGQTVTHSVQPLHLFTSIITFSTVIFYLFETEKSNKRIKSPEMQPNTGFAAKTQALLHNKKQKYRIRLKWLTEEENEKISELVFLLVLVLEASANKGIGNAKSLKGEIKL